MRAMKLLKATEDEQDNIRMLSREAEEARRKAQADSVADNGSDCELKDKNTTKTSFCEVCNIDMKCEKNLEDHMKGSKHAKKVRDRDRDKLFLAQSAPPKMSKTKKKTTTSKKEENCKTQ